MKLPVKSSSRFENACTNKHPHFSAGEIYRFRGEDFAALPCSEDEQATGVMYNVKKKFSFHRQRRLKAKYKVSLLGLVIYEAGAQCNVSMHGCNAINSDYEQEGVAHKSRPTSSSTNRGSFEFCPRCRRTRVQFLGHFHISRPLPISDSFRKSSRKNERLNKDEIYGFDSKKLHQGCILRASIAGRNTLIENR